MITYTNITDYCTCENLAKVYEIMCYKLYDRHIHYKPLGVNIITPKDSNNRWSQVVPNSKPKRNVNLAKKSVCSKQLW